MVASRNHTPAAALCRTRYDSGCPPDPAERLVGIRPLVVALAVTTYELALSMWTVSRDAISTVSRDPVALVATADGFLHALQAASPWRVSHAVLVLYGAYYSVAHLCLFALDAIASALHAGVSFSRALPHQLEECILSLLRTAALLPLLLSDSFIIIVVTMAAFGCLGMLHGIPIFRNLLHRVKTLVRGRHTTTKNGFSPSRTKNGHLVKPVGATYVTVSPKAKRYSSSSVPQKKVSFFDDPGLDSITSPHPTTTTPGKSVGDNGRDHSLIALQARQIQRLQEHVEEERRRNRRFAVNGVEMEEYRRSLAAEQGRCRLLQLQLHQLRAEMSAEGHPLEHDYRKSQARVQRLLVEKTEVKHERDDMEKSSLGFLDEIAKLRSRLKGIDKVHQCEMDRLRRRLIAAEAKLATSEEEAAQYRRHRHFFLDVDDEELKSAETEVLRGPISELRGEAKDKQRVAEVMI